MSYEVTDGIEESALKQWLIDAQAKYGLYKNQGVNFTDADIAPIVMCTILVNDEILIVKRGYGLADAEGYWSTINGFIDEIRPVNETAQKEILEELSIKINLSNIKVAKSYTLSNPKEKRKYIVFACLITLPSKPEINLDYENTEYRWIKRPKLESFHILEDLPLAVDTALRLKARN